MRGRTVCRPDRLHYGAKPIQRWLLHASSGLLGLSLQKVRQVTGTGSFRYSPITVFAWPLATVCMVYRSPPQWPRLSYRIGRCLGISTGIVHRFFFAFMAVFHFGLSKTSAANAGILIGTIPLFIMLISLLTGQGTAGIVCRTRHVVRFSRRFVHHGVFGVEGLSWGDGLVIISCMSWAFFTVVRNRPCQEVRCPCFYSLDFLFSTLVCSCHLSYMTHSGRTGSGFEPSIYWLYAVIAAVESVSTLEHAVLLCALCYRAVTGLVCTQTWSRCSLLFSPGSLPVRRSLCTTLQG